MIFYIGVQLSCAISYTAMTRSLLRIHSSDSPLATALGRDGKGKLSLALYLAALPLSLISPWIGIGLIVAVAIIWLIPDNRVVRALDAGQPPAKGTGG